MAKRKKENKGILNTASEKLRKTIEDIKQSRRKAKLKQAEEELAAAVRKSQEMPSNYELLRGRLKYDEHLYKKRKQKEAQDDESKTG